MSVIFAAFLCLCVTVAEVRPEMGRGLVVLGSPLPAWTGVNLAISDFTGAFTASLNVTTEPLATSTGQALVSISMPIFRRSERRLHTLMRRRLSTSLPDSSSGWVIKRLASLLSAAASSRSVSLLIDAIVSTEGV